MADGRVQVDGRDELRKTAKLRAGQVVSLTGVRIKLLPPDVPASADHAGRWVLALIAGIELAGKGGQWLAIVGGVYMLARVAHGFGMDGGSLEKGRGIGVMLVEQGLKLL